jgi:hypothetical protein
VAADIIEQTAAEEALVAILASDDE